MKIELRKVVLPDFGVPVELFAIPRDEYEGRASALYDAAQVDWVAIYGDREHSANLIFLSGFDPRFEEALLLLGPDGQRVLIVGNEGVGYADVAGLPVEVRLYQPFSLMGQPRDEAPRLTDVLRDVGMTAGARVGVAGWKYLNGAETNEPQSPSFVPAFVLRELRHLTSTEPIDITAMLMDPAQGLRTRNSACQIAAFEWAASRSSAAVMRVVQGSEPGMTELEAVGLMGYQGEPLACHVILASGKDRLNGLRSPSARRIERDDAVTVGIGLWGGLTCRAGLLSDDPDEDFVATFVRPYYAAIATWWQTVGIGATGGEVHEAVMAALDGAGFRPLLNPGHLTSYDEWVHSPIRPGSEERIVSGMMLQCDIIPTPLPPGRALNCEDTLAVGDSTLRGELARDHPEVWRRIQARRAFMRDEIGLRLKPEILPLSSAPAYLPPFWLDDDLVCVVGG